MISAYSSGSCTNSLFSAMTLVSLTDHKDPLAHPSFCLLFPKKRLNLEKNMVLCFAVHTQKTQQLTEGNSVLNRKIHLLPEICGKKDQSVQA